MQVTQGIGLTVLLCWKRIQKDESHFYLLTMPVNPVSLHFSTFLCVVHSLILSLPILAHCVIDSCNLSVAAFAETKLSCTRCE